MAISQYSVTFHSASTSYAVPADNLLSVDVGGASFNVATAKNATTSFITSTYAQEKDIVVRVLFNGVQTINHFENNDFNKCVSLLSQADSYIELVKDSSTWYARGSLREAKVVNFIRGKHLEVEFSFTVPTGFLEGAEVTSTGTTSVSMTPLRNYPKVKAKVTFTVATAASTSLSTPFGKVNKPAGVTTLTIDLGTWQITGNASGTFWTSPPTYNFRTYYNSHSNMTMSAATAISLVYTPYVAEI